MTDTAGADVIVLTSNITLNETLPTIGSKMTIDGTTANKYTIDGASTYQLGLQVNIHVFISQTFARIYEFTPGDSNLAEYQADEYEGWGQRRRDSSHRFAMTASLSLNNVDISNSRATNPGSIAGGGGAIYAEKHQ